PPLLQHTAAQATNRAPRRLNASSGLEVTHRRRQSLELGAPGGGRGHRAHDELGEADGDAALDERPQRREPHRRCPDRSATASHPSSGGWTGSGESLTSRKLPTAPSWLTVSPAHSRRSSGSASSMTAPRRLGSTPMASRSGAYVRPGTIVTSSRPLQSTSRLASCLARRSTVRAVNSIVVPRFRG